MLADPECSGAAVLTPRGLVVSLLGEGEASTLGFHDPDFKPSLAPTSKYHHWGLGCNPGNLGVHRHFNSFTDAPSVSVGLSPIVATEYLNKPLVSAFSELFC